MLEVKTPLPLMGAKPPSSIISDNFTQSKRVRSSITLLNSVFFSDVADPIAGKDLNLDAIVQCIRTSDKPHTHQQALLVLDVAAQIAPVSTCSLSSVHTYLLSARF